MTKVRVRVRRKSRRVAKAIAYNRDIILTKGLQGMGLAVMGIFLCA